jgi:DNA modification methylase
VTAVWRIVEGDARERLRELPERSVQACITSPPYFGLRDYGVDGQIGLEDRVDAYVDALVAVFGEVRRVLRDDGMLWLNLGDSYAGSGGAQGRRTGEGGMSAGQVAHHPKRASGTGQLRAAGVKPKDLYGIPWTVAFALRSDGWYLRSEIIWAKPSPMPESVRDRPTRSHEQVFLLSKSRRYYYDADAIREPAVSLDPAHRSFRPSAIALADSTGRREYSGKHPTSAKTVRRNGRNKRSVWTIPARPFKGAHFATFPPDLVRPMILATTTTTGNRSTVLDPFAGAATTGLEAVRLGRSFVGIELNPDYAKLGRQRVAADAPLLNTPARGPRTAELPQTKQLTLDSGEVPRPPQDLARRRHAA